MFDSFKLYDPTEFNYPGVDLHIAALNADDPLYYPDIELDEESDAL